MAGFYQEDKWKKLKSIGRVCAKPIKKIEEDEENKDTIDLFTVEIEYPDKIEEEDEEFDKDNNLLIEPDNIKILEVWVLIQQQWIFTYGQPVAINLQAVYPVLDMFELSNEDKLEVIQGILIIQQSYLKHLPKPKKNKWQLLELE